MTLPAFGDSSLLERTKKPGYRRLRLTVSYNFYKPLTLDMSNRK